MVDEWEHNLLSKRDYLSALNHEQQHYPPTYHLHEKDVFLSPGNGPSWIWATKLPVNILTDSPLLQNKYISKDLYNEVQPPYHHGLVMCNFLLNMILLELSSGLY